MVKVVCIATQVTVVFPGVLVFKLPQVAVESEMPARYLSLEMTASKLQDVSSKIGNTYLSTAMK